MHGICEGLAVGQYNIEIRVSKYAIEEAQRSIGNAMMGWNSNERFIVQEIRLGTLYSSGKNKGLQLKIVFHDIA